MEKLFPQHVGDMINNWMLPLVQTIKKKIWSSLEDDFLMIDCVDRRIHVRF